MKKIIIHSGKEKRELLVASAWHELTLHQLVEIETARIGEPDIIKIFSTLAGIDIQLAENIQDDDIERSVFETLEFLNEPPDWENLKRPTHLLIEGVPVKIPTNIGAQMFGQKIMLMSAIQTPEKMLQNINQAIAIFLQPEADKRRNGGKLKYDSERVGKIADDIKKLNGLQCYAVALFFFMKSKNFLRTGISGLKTYQEYEPRTKILSSDWLKRSASTNLQTLK